jgi:hypothetical protein
MIALILAGVVAQAAPEGCMTKDGMKIVNDIIKGSRENAQIYRRQSKEPPESRLDAALRQMLGAAAETVTADANALEHVKSVIRVCRAEKDRP